jgi:GntR family transcriptional repressor for pyruvate dehydrogenase complex
MNDSGKIIKPLSKTTLAQQVVEQLTNVIMQGTWKPGDLIPSEKDLSVMFNVGRSTIREAVQSLAVIGVLETRNGGRAVVNEPNSQLLSGAFRWGMLLNKHNIGNLTEVRTNIECECAELSAQRRSAEQLERMESLCEMLGGSDNADPGMGYDNSFHCLIAESTGNMIYANLVGTISAMVRVWFPSVWRRPGLIETTYKEHGAILLAIREKNPKNARKAMAYHIKTASERLMKPLMDGGAAAMIGK